MSAIYRKELKVYFSGAFGYAVTAILLFFMGLFVAVFQLLYGYADFSLPLTSMQWVFIILIPFLAARATAEERHNRTDILLSSLPLSCREIVLGKYAALFSLFLIPTAVSALYPLLLSGMGNVSLPAAYTAWLGYVLLFAALLALCLFLSSLTEHPLLGAVLCMAVLLLFYFGNSLAALLPTSAIFSFVGCLLSALCAGGVLWRASKNLTLGLLSAAGLCIPAVAAYLFCADRFVSLIPNAVTSLNLFSRFSGFTYGHLDIPGIVFYLTFTAFFLFVTVRLAEKRRLA